MSSSPLVEVVFEIRFKPQSNFATELLIAINQEITNHQDIIQADGLQFPPEFKIKQPEFYYIPSYRVNFPEYSLLISDGSLVVLKNTVDSVYSGWSSFKDIPKQILEILKKKNKVSDIERYSLKYTNLIQNHQSFNDLNLSLSIGSSQLDSYKKFTVKTEEIEGSVVILNEVSSHVNMDVINDLTKERRTFSGILIVIDIINNQGINNIDEVDNEFAQSLERLHDIAYKKYTSISKEV
jgi:uncharacterized protein (TIGR04255 family)